MSNSFKENLFGSNNGIVFGSKILSPPTDLIKKKPSYVQLEIPKNTKIVKGSSVRQVLAALIANLGTVNTGMVFGFSAMVIPQLQQPDSIIQINESQASWIACLSSATTPVGCILSGYLMDRIGRKHTLLLTELPLIIGWILISAAQNVEMIYIGRLFVGLGSGMVGAPARVYTSEVTQPHLRGMLSAMAAVGISFGVLFQYILGSILSWQLLAISSGLIPVLALILMLIVPETPSYLVASAKIDSARTALKKLRASECNINQEIDQIQSFREKNNVKKLESTRELLKEILKPSTLKPFTILALYFFMYQCSGVNAITFYAVEIFQNSGTNINKYLATIILGITRLIFTIVGCVLSRKCGRRPLTFASGIGCGLSMISLGAYLFLYQKWTQEGISPVYTWFPVACILIFTVACSVGFLIVPWIMIGEVYPTSIRGTIGGITTCCAHLSIFIVVKTFPFICDLIHNYGAFLLYGSISLSGTFILYFYLPETSGKTLQEIEDYFSGRNSSLMKKRSDKKEASRYNNSINSQKLQNPLLTETH